MQTRYEKAKKRKMLRVIKRDSFQPSRNSMLSISNAIYVDVTVHILYMLLAIILYNSHLS